MGMSYKPNDSRRALEKLSKEGDRPVDEIDSAHESILSTVGHVVSGRNLGGPPSKAKYEHSTDSELVP